MVKELKRGNVKKIVITITPIKGIRSTTKIEANGFLNVQEVVGFLETAKWLYLTSENIKAEKENN